MPGFLNNIRVNLGMRNSVILSNGTTRQNQDRKLVTYLITIMVNKRAEHVKMHKLNPVRNMKYVMPLDRLEFI